MLRVEVYNSESPMENTASIFHLIQKQMEYIGSPKSLEQIEQALTNIFRSNSGAVIFVGYDNYGLPAAFAFGNLCAGLESGGDYFWLNELYVDASCRNLGYADTLLSYAEDWLKGRGVKYIACVTGRENIAAQNLYRKKGFVLDSAVWVDKKI